MHIPTDTDLLALWESGRVRHPIDRALLLGARARPDLAPTQLAGLPLGVLGSALLRLWLAWLGPRIDAYLDCSACGERLSVSLDPGDLLAATDAGDIPAAADIPEIQINGIRIRALTSRDLAAVAGEPDADAAALQLLARCCVAPRDTPVALLADLRARIEAGLETLDPAADLSLALTCDHCGHFATVSLDIAALLWDELEARARALIGEVHALARAYGWAESEVLALPSRRRAAYLELLGA